MNTPMLLILLLLLLQTFCASPLVVLDTSFLSAEKTGSCPQVNVYSFKMLAGSPVLTLQLPVTAKYPGA